MVGGGATQMKAAKLERTRADRVPVNVPADDQELVIRVDRLDNSLGSAGKLDVHRTGELHRAFSIFVFDPAGKVLLQRRADCKYHFAGLWSNTCCGHPRPGETTARAAARRLREEFGFSTPLAEIAQIVYHAGDPVSGLVEHEYLHVFRGTFTGAPRPDPEEIGAYRWLPLSGVRDELDGRTNPYTPWFELLFRRLFRTEAATR
jgi:isopentenyl-diphosphate delta-isomerase